MLTVRLGAGVRHQRSVRQYLISILANLFMHYAFDLWMKRSHPDLPWCRYADDGLVHCRSEQEAEAIKAELQARLADCQLQKQCREFWNEPDRHGSDSRVMTPDVAAEHGPGESQDGSPHRARREISYRAQRDALCSIHTYGDVREAESGAVEGIVTAAYLLTPYLPVLEGDRETRMPGAPPPSSAPEGLSVGAVTLRPGMTIPEIGAAPHQIVSDAMAPAES